MRRNAGFNLIELLMVMLVISVGLLGLTPLFGNSAKSLATNETLQRATQYGQQCAEQVLTTRRTATTFAVSGAASFVFNDTTIPACADIDGYSRSAEWAAGAAYLCPGSATISCRNVNITVTKDSLSSNITVMLAEY